MATKKIMNWFCKCCFWLTLWNIWCQRLDLIFCHKSGNVIISSLCCLVTWWDIWKGKADYWCLPMMGDCALYIQTTLNETFRDSLTCGLTLADNYISCAADSKQIATGRLNAASCYQIITSSTSDAVIKKKAMPYLWSPNVDGYGLLASASQRVCLISFLNNAHSEQFRELTLLKTNPWFWWVTSCEPFSLIYITWPPVFPGRGRLCQRQNSSWRVMERKQKLKCGDKNGLTWEERTSRG